MLYGVLFGRMMLLAVGITAILCNGSPLAAQTPLRRNDIAAQWDFTAGNGATLRDISGNGHHGAIRGATWVRGNWGHALSFDRSKSNYIHIPDSPKLHLQPPYSFGVWFRTTSSKNNAVYLLKNGGTFTGHGLYFYGDSRAMYVDAKSIDNKLYHKGGGLARFCDGTWHHAVGTLGNGKQRLFVDGKIFVERAVPKDLKLSYAGTKGIQLGCWLGQGHFDGMMGQAFVLKRDLRPAEVQKLYLDGRKRFHHNFELQQTGQPPKIDGKLTDALWKRQSPLRNFVRLDYDSSTASNQTTAWLSYDAENLYFAARCRLRAQDRLHTAGRARDDVQTATDDHVEIYLRTTPTTYHQIRVTAGNVVLDRKCEFEVERKGFAPGGFAGFHDHLAWDCPGLRSAVQTEKGHWTVELAIPRSSLGVTNRGTWQMNVARWSAHARERSTFSPLYAQLAQPDLFSHLGLHDNQGVLRRAAKKQVSIDLTPLAKANPDSAATVHPIVFVDHYMRRGSYTTRPTQRSSRSIDLFASWGEFEPATISVRATGRELKHVVVKVAGALRSNSGDSIPTSHVDVRLVELWRRQVNSRYHMFMERFLEKQTTLDIPRHTTRRFWLTVHVPKDVAAGTYKSKIQIVSQGKVIQALPLSLEVLPIQLQQAAGMGYFMYLPTWGIPPKLRTKSYLKRIFVDMRHHGMTTATLYPYGLPFDSVMNVLRDSKLMNNGVPAIWLGADAVGPAKWKAVLDQGKREKWPELALYLQDEPGDAERIKNAKRLFRILEQFRQQHPEHKQVRSTTAIGSIGIKALGQHYDIWIAGAGFDDQLVKQSQRMNKLLWSYDCNLAPVDAESCRHYFGLWCWKTGIKGCALWAYADPGSTSPTAWDPILKDVTKAELHYSFVRPMPDDLVPTIGWEAVREGVDDYRYLVTLSEAVARAANRGIDVSRAKGLLAKVGRTIDVQGYRASIQGGRASQLRMGEHYDRTSPQRKLSPHGYDQLRRAVANEIRRLQRSK